jgi:beta-glucanase (GH16 family)
MKKTLMIAVASMFIISCKTQEKEPAFLDNYTLEWNDEFETDQLDTSKWAFRADNKHKSVQLRENVSVKDGSLLLNLNIHEEAIDGKNASGAGIISKRRFKYGYYEVRSQLGDGKDHDGDGKIDEGWHHSFWAMAAEINDKNEVSTTYPGIRRTEIDCYENPSSDGNHKKGSRLNRFTQHVIVWDEEGKEWGRLPKPPTDITVLEEFDASQWHTYGFEWSESTIKFYVDGNLNKIADYSSKDFAHDDINIWLTAMAASWTGNDQEKSVGRYDYFRFYKRK